MQGYIPSVQDVLHCQSPTIGISELVVDISETVLCRLISFGGSRSSRRRWIHVFEDVTCVFFFVASNEFDQTLREDGETNRLRESITLFEVILNYPWFRSAPIFLILNKCDLLSEKIKEKNIGDYFSDFEVCNTMSRVRMDTSAMCMCGDCVIIIILSRVIPIILMMSRNFYSTCLTL